jgi:hypothetical protein
VLNIETLVPCSTTLQNQLKLLYRNCFPWFHDQVPRIKEQPTRDSTWQHFLRYDADSGITD